MSAPPPEIDDKLSLDPHALLADVCLPLLLRLQNQDGGWGFHAGGESAIEPTAWVLVALGGLAGLKEARESVERGHLFLLTVQLPDGSWPAFPCQSEGCWVTSLACLALWSSGVGHIAALDGAEWLCRERPGENSRSWRFHNFLLGGRKISQQDHSLYGWPWSHGTASWVEPTAMALVALERIPASLLPSSSAERRRIGYAMLVNRMCAGGGWNCGNPEVYGAPGRPLVGPTVWALLALRHSNETRALEDGLRWLEGRYPEIRSPVSGVLSHLCLKMYGRGVSPIGPEVKLCNEPSCFLNSTPLLAWSMMALHTHKPGGPRGLFTGM